MISKDWETFNKYITIKDKEISIYEDTEGNYAILPTANLLCGVQYNELTEEQLNVAKFNKQVPKDIKLKTKERAKIVTKDTITGKAEDKDILTENGKEQVYEVWFVIDGMKNTSPYSNKQEAIEKAKKRNEEILGVQ